MWLPIYVSALLLEPGSPVWCLDAVASLSRHGVSYFLYAPEVSGVLVFFFVLFF